MQNDNNPMVDFFTKLQRENQAKENRKFYWNCTKLVALTLFIMWLASSVH